MVKVRLGKRVGRGVREQLIGYCCEGVTARVATEISGQRPPSKHCHREGRGQEGSPAAGGDRLWRGGGRRCACGSAGDGAADLAANARVDARPRGMLLPEFHQNFKFLLIHYGDRSVQCSASDQLRFSGDQDQSHQLEGQPSLEGQRVMLCHDHERGNSIFDAAVIL